MLILGKMNPHPWLLICIGIALILGHDFSPYLGFKGGKGVATSLGVFLFFSPKAILISLILWIALVALFRIVSVASIGAALILPTAIYWIGYPRPILLFSIFASLLLIIRHRINILRLFRGQEKRLGKRRVEGLDVQ